MNNKFQLAQIFTDNMVLQRDACNTIWGNAKSGSEIYVEFCGQIFETEASGGKWHVILSPISSGGPYGMKIRSGTDEIVLRNILIGEVWVAGGQSNMQFILNDSLHGKEEVAEANYETIRFYDVPRIAFEDDDNEKAELPKASWKICNSENAGQFSAVAFYYAKNLLKELDIPIGIIGCNMGATSASCWMSEEYLETDEQIKTYLDEYYDQMSKHSEEEYEAELALFIRKFEEHIKKVELFKVSQPNASELLIHKNVGFCPWPPPMGRKTFMRPAGLYHTMLKKIVPYGIKGVIFYQGESDDHKANLYKKLFCKMIQNWRDEWNNSTLPFLFVQIAYYGYSANPKGEEWAIVREQQLLTSQCDNNTGMVTITDCGELENIHPVDKKTVGERLALLARAKIYGHNVEYSGPIYCNMKMNGNRAVLYFNHAVNGFSVKDGELKGFKICGEDLQFIDAKAVIVENTIEVFAEGVTAPKAVRYGWANYAEVNLYNQEGIPASPFRTDSFL